MTTTLTRRGVLGMLGRLELDGLDRPIEAPDLVFGHQRARGPRGDVLVLVFLRGGMDGLSAVVPFAEGGPYYNKRPTIAIREPNGSDAAAIDLDGRFGLHPALRPLKEIYDARYLAVVHATGSPDPTRSHFEAMDVMDRGTPGRRSTDSGWLNRYLKATAGPDDTALRAVGLGAQLPGVLQGPSPALALTFVEGFQIAASEADYVAVHQTLRQLYRVSSPNSALDHQAREVFGTIELVARVAGSEYQPAPGVVYPETEYGQSLKQVAQLIKESLGLEVACVEIGGWDTHENQGDNEGRLAGVLSEFAQGLAAFYRDLSDRIDQVTVVTLSEFGRRVEENASGGTDHGHGNCLFILGGGVNSGVYTRWPGLRPDQLNDGDLAITIDYRDVLAEVLAARLLSPALDQIFPSYTPRPVGLVRRR